MNISFLYLELNVVVETCSVTVTICAKSKAVLLHAMEVLHEGGGIAPTNPSPWC
jgi:hypothetical protein